MIVLSERFERAFAYAHGLHRTQRRKGDGTPYVAHLLAVASLVIEAGGDEDEAIAALLHDAVEDQGGTPVLEEIRRRFGARVAGIVAGCSEPVGSDRPPWRTRKKAHLERIAGASAAVLRVVAADKLHNARTLLSAYRRDGEAVWQRFSGGREGTLWYYRAMADALAAAGAPVALTDELDRVVAEIERAAGS